MEFVRGNRAIRDHALEGKDLHLFQSLSKGGGYRYLGRFTCPSWQFREGVDVNGEERQVIVFHLIQPEDDEPTAPTQGSATLSQLRHRALERVMNSIRNALGMRETEIAREPKRAWNPHFYAIFSQVHNTL